LIKSLRAEVARNAWAVPVALAAKHIIGVIDAHELESMSCDNDGEAYCSCLADAVRSGKAALSATPPAALARAEAEREVVRTRMAMWHLPQQSDSAEWRALFSAAQDAEEAACARLGALEREEVGR
jgi:hypothetical protein